MTVLGLVAYLASQGCALPCSAGIIANLERESRLNPAALSVTGAGLPQWSGKRRARLFATLGARWRDAHLQLHHMVIELGEFGIKDRLFAERDPARAARIFFSGFEMPGRRPPALCERRAREIYREALAYGR